jgi:polysaccharide deacetylase family protein (PEP-CTERM system associated)
MGGGGDFLFGLDVEDVRHRMAGGDRLPARVPQTTQLFLDLLDACGGRGTFFIVGDVARAEPGLVRAIAAAGHEIACHSDAHLPLGRLGPAGLREDLLRCLDALAKAGAGEVRGFRAPFFSLTAQTRWAYDVLARLGFTYSSSVLPARSPLYGWPGFGAAPRRIDDVVELPVTLLPVPRVPAGGVYFRALPEALVAHGLARARRRGAPVVGYFHPYDADADGPRHAFPEFARNPLANWLMYRGRAGLPDRLRRLAARGFRFQAYRPYADALRTQAELRAAA